MQSPDFKEHKHASKDSYKRYEERIHHDWTGEMSLEDAWQHYEEQGYVIFPSILPAEDIANIQAALSDFFDKKGRNNFEGFKSHRVYALLAKEPALMSKIVAHPLVMYFVERQLGPTCLLSALLAICLLPGETVQPWHRDDTNITIPLPRPAYGVSAFWSIDATTLSNGATEIIPGSHLWGSDGVAFTFDENSPEILGKLEQKSIRATMPQGSLMLTKGTLLHRGGANHSEHNRTIITPQYCAGWARQLESMLLAVPQSVVKKLPSRIQELIGYNIHGTFMGYVDGVHPNKTLK